MSVGIDKQINCYSMVPWELSFQYYDQATNSLQFVKTAPGEAAYEEMWGAMLASFSKHLKEKGWFDICAIAMDERPMEVMQKTLKVIRKLIRILKYRWLETIMRRLSPIYMITVLSSDRTSRKKCVCVV